MTDPLAGDRIRPSSFASCPQRRTNICCLHDQKAYMDGPSRFLPDGPGHNELYWLISRGFLVQVFAPDGSAMRWDRHRLKSNRVEVWLDHERQRVVMWPPDSLRRSNTTRASRGVV